MRLMELFSIKEVTMEKITEDLENLEEMNEEAADVDIVEEGDEDDE